MFQPSPYSYGAPSKAAIALASKGVAAGGAALTGTATGASTAAAGLLSAAGASSLVPVAGWVVAGGLLAAAGVALLVSRFRDKGRREALAFAESLGEGGKAFAREYARNADKSDAKIQSEIVTLRGKIAAKQAKDRRLFKRAQDRREATLVDQLNANLVILGLRAQAPTTPVIAAEPATSAVQADAGLSDGAKVAIGLGGVALVGLLAYSITSRSR